MRQEEREIPLNVSRHDAKRKVTERDDDERGRAGDKEGEMKL